MKTNFTMTAENRATVYEVGNCSFCGGECEEANTVSMSGHNLREALKRKGLIEREKMPSFESTINENNIECCTGCNGISLLQTSYS